MPRVGNALLAIGLGIVVDASVGACSSTDSSSSVGTALPGAVTALARLRGQLATARIPIIMLTGCIDPAYGQLSEGVGAAAT